MNRELLKATIQPLRDAGYNGGLTELHGAIDELFHHSALLQLAFPFETLADVAALKQVFTDLYAAIPDLERRDTIVMAGENSDGSQWVGCCGYYCGSFEADWLDIPATGHMVSMRFHEFYRISDGKVTELQALWDIPEVMMQANAWPMSPSLGREWHVPGPATQDGLTITNRSDTHADESATTVLDMCNALGNYATGGVEAMRLNDYWHQRCSWYGPAGIGTARSIQNFRNWHQIPFLNGLPDRVGDAAKGYLLGDGDYVGFTAWPGMFMSVSGDGWLGIAPSGQQITMRSLDFWRCEGELIRENWVLVDILHVYHQLGVDVFKRLREFNKARR